MKNFFVIKYRLGIILSIYAAVWEFTIKGRRVTSFTHVCEIGLLSHRYSWIDDLIYKLNALVGVFSVMYFPIGKVYV